MTCLPDEQYSLPEAVGQLFDATIPSNDALRILADDWCRLSQSNLLRAGALVRPLREAVNARRTKEGNTEDVDVEARTEICNGDADALTELGFSSALSEDSLAGSSSD